MKSKTYINRRKIPCHVERMDLLKILDNLEKFEHLNFESRNRLRLTDKITVLPWKRNYWIDHQEPLQNKSYHRRLQRLRKKKCQGKH